MKNGIKAFQARTILLILAFSMLLAYGCGQKPQETPKVAATAVPSASVAPTAQAAANQAPDETKVDMSMDSINISDYFGSIIKKVRSDWKSDAKMTSVRANFLVKDFSGLMKLRTDYNYDIIFYSLGTKTEIKVTLNNLKKDSSGLPEIKYSVTKKDNSSDTMLTADEIKQSSDWIFKEYPRSELYDVYKNFPDNYFTGWAMKMSDVIKAMIVRSKAEKVTGMGVYISFAYSVQEKTPLGSMYWENGSTKTYFYIEPVTGKKYDKTL